MSSPTEGRYDQLFLTLANQVGSDGIDGLLDAFFSFLRRKTDFFSGGGEGLPRVQGAVDKALTRHWDLAEKEAAKESARKVKAAAEKVAAAEKAEKIAIEKAQKVKAATPAASEVVELGVDGSFDIRAAARAAADAPKSAAEVARDAGDAAIAVAAAKGGAKVGDGASTADDSAATAAATTAAAPTAGNGGVTDRYVWTQTLQDVSINFPVAGSVRGKDITVDVKNRSLSVSVKGMPPLLSVDLGKRVKAADASWTLEDARGGNKVLNVVLIKENQMEWWTKVSCCISFFSRILRSYAHLTSLLTPNTPSFPPSPSLPFSIRLVRVNQRLI